MPLNLTTDVTDPFVDNNGHGTHVLGTIVGTGAADSRFRGVAPGIGASGLIRVVKVFDHNNNGSASWIEAGMDSMVQGRGSTQPLLVNLSGGLKGYGLTGTDSTSRKLDQKVWTNRQLYVVAAGNEGSGARTIRTPAVAKNALTVGSISDMGDFEFVVAGSSSRGPTGDGRMKPNLVAPGQTITSAFAGSTNYYITKKGTSHAAAHVTGLAATLMEHYPYFQYNPALLRAHMMGTAIAHDEVTAKSNDYGLGHASGYVAHWDHPNSSGWSTHRFAGSVDSQAYHYTDVVVPPGTKRLVVVLTWDEPPQSAGATKAVIWDLDLWVDRNGDCSSSTGACGEYASMSRVDNVEYVVVNDPPAGNYRLKVSPYSAPFVYGLPFGLTATIIRGDPTPALNAYLTASPTAHGRLPVRRDGRRVHAVLRGVGGSGPGPDHLSRHHVPEHPQHAHGRRHDELPATLRVPEARQSVHARQPLPVGQPIRHLDLPGRHARSQDVHDHRLVEDPRAVLAFDDGQCRSAADGSGRDGADDEPARAHPGARGDVLGHGHGAE